MKKYGLHQCRKMLILLILFAVIMSMNAQTTIALEEDTKIKITLPNGYDVLPKLQNDEVVFQAVCPKSVDFRDAVQS